MRRFATLAVTLLLAGPLLANDELPSIMVQQAPVTTCASIPVGAGLNVLPMFDLRRTDLNWARIGEGLGIESTRATSAEEFASQYRAAMSQRGPRLIEALVEQPMPAAAGLRSLS